MSYGRDFLVTETEAAEIKAHNNLIKTSHKRAVFKCRRKVQDYLLAKEMGITVAELNKNRMRS